jgi:2-oxoglutarate dehydrogenase E2 component (dihydrolipoamide succinyltransferase)
MISIKVPPLGESIVEATISRWTKNEGDAVAAGETLVELETDKITVEVPALKAGVLAKRLKAEGDVVKVDELLGELDDSAAGAGGGGQAAAGGSGQASEGAASQPASAGSGQAAAGAGSQPAAAADGQGAAAGGQAAADGSGQAAVGGGQSTKASPAAQRVAAESGVDIGSLSGTGRGGMVTKQDVVAGSGGSAAAGQPRASGDSQPAATNDKPAAGAGQPQRPTGGSTAAGTRETREKMTTRRKRIAENLLQAQHSTAHLTTFNEIDMTAVEALRGRVRDRIEKEHGVRLSIMPFFVRAAVMALESYPVVNAQIDGDSIVYKHYVNMGIAVASEAGLVVPNIKDADRKPLIEIAKEISSVAKRARDGKLTMDDLTGGTFTITNGGVFGSLVSTPIINYPQVGILGLHKTQDRPVAVGGEVVIRPMMYVALSYDHRIIDGQQAVLFLVRVKELMEDPALMVVG